jgi:hypothetical protein
MFSCSSTHTLFSVMKLLVVVILFGAFFATSEGVSCLQSQLTCNPSCDISYQMTVTVNPKSDATAACNLIDSSPNYCCLLGSVAPSGQNYVYQNWCCSPNSNPASPGVAAVEANIANVSYLTVGKKRSTEDTEGMFHFLCLNLLFFFCKSISNSTQNITL